MFTYGSNAAAAIVQSIYIFTNLQRCQCVHSHRVEVPALPASACIVRIVTRVDVERDGKGEQLIFRRLYKDFSPLPPPSIYLSSLSPQMGGAIVLTHHSREREWGVSNREQ